MLIILINILNVLLNLYFVILVLRVLISWINVDPYNPVARFLYGVTEPLLQPIRSLLPQTGMIDFSPMVAMLFLFALQRGLAILAGYL